MQSLHPEVGSAHFSPIFQTHIWDVSEAEHQRGERDFPAVCPIYNLFTLPRVFTFSKWLGRGQTGRGSILSISPPGDLGVGQFPMKVVRKQNRVLSNCIHLLCACGGSEEHKVWALLPVLYLGLFASCWLRLDGWFSSFKIYRWPNQNCYFSEIRSGRGGGISYRKQLSLRVVTVGPSAEHWCPSPLQNIWPNPRQQTQSSTLHVTGR